MNEELDKEKQLLCFQAINNCETFDDMELAITVIGNANNGIIKGKTKSYSTQQLIDNIKLVRSKQVTYNALTREFGIRQQAIYLHYYGES